MALEQLIDLIHVRRDASPCSYLPHETWQFDNRIPWNLDAVMFGELLRRGWRRFGTYLFRPACPACRQCRPLRVLVDQFQPSKSQRRNLRRNGHIRIEVQAPTVSEDHIRLYNEYHSDMARRRGWPEKETDADDYFESFIGGDYEFAHEFLYFDGDRLVGVSIVDVTPVGLSSAYFFHDPHWRPLGPGTYSVLNEIHIARQLGVPHLYLGYWIERNQSMSYKAKFTPHELLERFGADSEEPVWRPAPAATCES